MTPGFDPDRPGAADAPAGALPLADAIASLRAELERAMTAARATEEGLRLDAQAVQLTVEVTATTTGTGRAGIRWWLLDAGGEASHARATTQSVTLTFVPTVPDADGGRVAPTFRPATGAEGRDGDVTRAADSADR